MTTGSFIPISNASRRFRQSPSIGGSSPPIGSSSPSHHMFGSGGSNGNNAYSMNGNGNSRNSEAMQSFLGCRYET